MQALWLMLSVTAATAPATGPATEASWQTVEVLHADSLTVRLRVLDRATLADEQWLGLQFDNTGDKAIRIRSAQYYTHYEQSNLRTGTPWRSGSLASGNDYDLFPAAWETTPVSPILIPRGVRRIIAQPSDYSSALLGLPLQDGTLVRAHIHLSVDVEGMGSFSTPTGGVGFQFEWVYPDKSGFASMRSRLRKLLESPERRAEHVYILGALLSVPGVGDDMPVETILSALNARRENMDGRDRLVSWAAEHFPKDPKVLEYYRRRLQAQDTRAVEDLVRAPAIWAPDFISPLLAACERADHGIPLAWLKVLSAHRGDWPRDTKIPARLSASVLRNSHLLSRKPDEVRGPDLAGRWRFEAQALALTGDSAVIPLLRPFLDDKERVLDLRLWAPPLIFPQVPPLRVCDVALESILTILGDDVQKAYRAAAGVDDSPDEPLPKSTSRPGTEPRVSGRLASRPSRNLTESLPRTPEAIEQRMNELRDRMITELKQRLARGGTGK